MNRADRLYEVLKDGKPHSRQDIFNRGGFYLSNNAASELRARGREEGFAIVHTCEVRVIYGRIERTDYYRLVPASAPSSANDSAPLPMRRPIGESAGEGGADGALAESSEGGPSGGPHEPRGLGDAMRPSAPSPSLDSEGGEQLALLAPEPTRREMYA